MQNQTQSQPDNPHQWQWPHAPAEPPDNLNEAERNTAQQEAQRESRIRDEAYRIAEQRGFPERAAMDHWLEAENRFSQPGSDSERF